MSEWANVSSQTILKLGQGKKMMMTIPVSSHTQATCSVHSAHKKARKHDDSTHTLCCVFCVYTLVIQNDESTCTKHDRFSHIDDIGWKGRVRAQRYVCECKNSYSNIVWINWYVGLSLVQMCVTLKHDEHEKKRGRNCGKGKQREGEEKRE